MTPNRRLKQERELRGWSQAKVAEQLGTDATTVSRWERGLFSPTPYFRERLCTLFNKNAEELGLLETSGQSPAKEPQAISERRPRALSPFPQESLALPEETRRQHFAGPPAGIIAPPIAPSWVRRGDTFAYILDSAAHDQQAHILWEDAYVRAMRGQHAEARQLGEASLNAFENVGHTNAEALREWLQKNDLTPSSPPPTNIPSAPLPLLRKQPKWSIKRLFPWRNTGLLLLAIMVLSLVSFASNQLALPRVQAGVQTSMTTKMQIALQPTSAPTVASTPTSLPTTRPTSAPTTPDANAAALNISITPTSLTPANCQPDSGYRCTLTVTLYSDGQDSLKWRIASPSLPVLFNPGNGTSLAGHPFEIIAYIQSPPGQEGQLVFTLTSSASTKTVAIPWQG